MIHDAGRSDSEYSNLEDITVQQATNQLQLISNLDQKLLSYSPDGSALQKVKKLPKRFIGMKSTQQGYWGYTGNSSRDSLTLWQMDNQVNSPKGYIDINSGFRDYFISGINYFSSYGTNTYFTRFMDYNIYLLKPGHQPRIAYTLDFGEAAWPEEVNTLALMDKMSFIEKAGYIESLRYFQETNDFVAASFIFGGQQRIGLYNKVEKTAQVYALTPVTQKYFFSFGQVIGITENEIFTLVDAARMMNFIAGHDARNNNFEEKYPQQIKRLRKDLGHIKINEQSNPFLISYKIH